MSFVQSAHQSILNPKSSITIQFCEYIPRHNTFSPATRTPTLFLRTPSHTHTLTHCLSLPITRSHTRPPHPHPLIHIHTCARTHTHTHAIPLSPSLFLSLSVIVFRSLSLAHSLSLSHTHTHTGVAQPMYGEITEISRTLLLIFVLCVTVVMLNVLIAQLTITYERVLVKNLKSQLANHLLKSI